MKPAKDMKQTLRYKNKVANLKSRPAYVKEAELLREIAGGKQWRIDAVLAAVDVKPEDWSKMNQVNIFEQAAMFGRLSTIQKMSENSYFEFDKRAEESKSKKNRSYAPYEIRRALDMALLHGHTKVADYCVSLGATPEHLVGDKTAPRAMYQAIKDGNKRIMDGFVKAGGNVNDYLNEAVSENDKETLSHLIKKGADVNSRSDRYGSPFLVAVQHGYTALALYLLDQGYDLKKAQDTPNAMFMAIDNKNTVLVDAMLKRGVAVDESHLQSAKCTGDAAMVALVEKHQPVAKPAAPSPAP